MALPQKQGINIPFGQGLNTKVDPKQLQMGKMLALENVSFNRDNELVKRNGFGRVNSTVLDATSIASFNDTLLAISTELQAYSENTDEWISTGTITPCQLTTIPLVRNSADQSTADVQVATNGLACVAYTSDGDGYYSVHNSETGQIIVAPTLLVAGAEFPRIFILGNYFVILFMRTITGARHLQYIAVPVNNPTAPHALVDLSSQVKTTAFQDSYDAISSNDNLYIAWNASDLGGAIRMLKITSGLIVSANTVLAGEAAPLAITLAADESGPTANIYVIWGSSTHVRATVRDHNLLQVTAPTNITAQSNINHITAYADNQQATIVYQVTNTYTLNSDRTDLVYQITMAEAGTAGSPSLVQRGVGLVSKVFLANSVPYILCAYGVQGETYQPSYFLLNLDGEVIGKVAYSNAEGYPPSQILTNVQVIDSVAHMAGLIVSTLVPVNKSQGAASSLALYSQTGVNLISFDFNITQQSVAVPNVGLMMTGGQLWDYDGIRPVEQGFHVWPDEFGLVDGAVGDLTAQEYFYAVTYEWTDAQGNLHRSAPSVPQSITLVGGPQGVTLTIPTLRLTAKRNPNPVRIVIYRWSTAQQVYYQVTDIEAPLLNDPSVDEVTYVDSLADADILGNPILYTTGGVLENIAPPAVKAVSLFKSRLIYISAENPNLLGFSKQIVQGVPVETTDAFTIYASPTLGAESGSGGLSAITAMDDKILLARKNAWYYVTGNGPDNTGANNDFSEPVFITSTVGCDNQNSIVLTPLGVMFQSDKGIWLLGRDLSTKYIGAPVQAYNDQLVTSAVSVPGSTEVRFTLDSGVILVYNYYYDQWSIDTGVRAVYSTIWNGVHAVLTDYGLALKETPGVYLDNATPVLMKFTTAWLKLTDLQGFQRAYFFYLMGNYDSPHFLTVNLAYDYNPAQVQTATIVPTNYSPAYGDDSPYGSGTPYGGPDSLEQFRVFFDQQKCQSVQISVQETFDPSYGTVAGAGLSLSGINVVIGAKKGYPTLPGAQSVS